MTQQTSTITFDTEEALAIIMALELVAENPGISMRIHGQIYDVNPKYLTAIAPIRKRLFESHLAQKKFTMTQSEFIALVSQMRIAQQTYFRTKDRAVLDRSKDLERQVDRAIAQQQQKAEQLILSIEEI